MKDFIVSNPFGESSARHDRVGLSLYSMYRVQFADILSKIRRFREVRQNRHRA